MANVKFTTNGNSKSLDLCKYILAQEGFQYVEDITVASFILAGGDTTINSSLPAIILSSGNVYNSLSPEAKITERPFSEHDILTIPSTHSSPEQAELIYFESKARQNFPSHTVLRLFDIYGGRKSQGWIDIYANILRTDIKASLPITFSPQRKISCLYIDDFRTAFILFVNKFINGLRGLYNLGSDQSITFEHLADTIFQMFSESKEKALTNIVTINTYTSFFQVPDITRFCAITGWKPSTSLRRGIWLFKQSLTHG